MLFSCDRIGFPLVHVPGAQLVMQLFPTTKAQFERFLAEPGGFGDTWYAAILAVNPRVAARAVEDATRERLFLTGILPDEAQRYARWLGASFRLPTVEEWKLAYRALQNNDTWQSELQSALASCCDAAKRLCQAVLDQVQPASLAQLALMEGGVLEWVQDGARWGGFGKPRSALYYVCREPLTWPPVYPMRATDRLAFFGMRAVSRE